MMFSRASVAGIVLVMACTAVPPTAPDAVPDTNQPPLMGQTVASRFTGAGGHQGAGGVTLTVEGNRARLEFAADFRVDAVPGPFVYLSTSSNVNSGAPLRVAALQRNSGSQSYTFLLPPGVSYTWVLVWCDPFNVGVAEARINSTP